MAVVECEGRMKQIDDAFILRDALTAQREPEPSELDLSEVTAIEGGRLGMLDFLKDWAQDYDIRFTNNRIAGVIADNNHNPGS
jgi:hypothetical protein